MKKPNRKCILCPTHQYHFCGQCSNQKVTETWRYLFDSENCRDIYKILENFVAKKITADDAKEQLDKYNLPNKEDMQPALRKNLEDIYDQAKKEKIVENVIISDTTEESTDSFFDIKENNEEETTKPTRRRNSFRRNFE